MSYQIPKFILLNTLKFIFCLCVLNIYLYTAQNYKIGFIWLCNIFLFIIYIYMCCKTLFKSNKKNKSQKNKKTKKQNLNVNIVISLYNSNNVFIDMCSNFTLLFYFKCTSYNLIVYNYLFTIRAKNLSNKLKSYTYILKKNMQYCTISNNTSSESASSAQKLFNIVKKLPSIWSIRYTPTTVVKHIPFLLKNIFEVLYLRKVKIFNKGRYSRNRQFYRTGVYWCLYLNIILVIGLYFWFYRFTMNFGYLWSLGYLGLISIILPKVLKYRLYNLKVLRHNYVSNMQWLSNFIMILVDRYYPTSIAEVYIIVTDWIEEYEFEFYD